MRISDWSSDVCSSDLLRSNSAFICICSAGEADFCNPQSNRSNKNDKRGPCLKSDRPSRTEREHWEADMDFRDVQETGASNVMISEQADLLEAPAKAAETAPAKLEETMAYAAAADTSRTVRTQLFPIKKDDKIGRAQD